MCYWYKGHYIPDCYGGAIYGPEWCDCKTRKTTAIERVIMLEKAVMEMSRGLEVWKREQEAKWNALAKE